MCAHAYIAAKELVLISILQGYALVGEKTYLVVNERHAGSVICAEQEEGHISTEIHRAGIVFKTCHVEGVCRHDIEFWLLSHRCRVEIRFHVPVVAERCVILRLCPYRKEQRKRNCYI